VSADAVRDAGGAVPASAVRLPTFLIVGAMRSGTTSLTRYLRSHPEVFIAPHKELHFFDFRYAEGIDWYRSNFEGAQDEIAVGEATPNYLYIAEALPRAAELLPEARLVAILRDPVERAYSHYWHNRAVGREELGFDEALEAEPRRIASDDPHQRAYWSYVDRGRYVRQLRALERLYPREALLVLLFDDLRDAPGETYRSVCRFLGVSDEHVPPELGEAVNSFVGFRSRRLRSLSRRLPKTAGRVVGRLNARDESYPPMPARVRSALVERFRQDNAELADWLGRDLSSWLG
jgi:hypothetical protein